MMRGSLRAAERRSMKKGVYRGIITLAAVVLSARLGRITYGADQHYETFYNLSMKRVVQRAKANGIPGEYWEAENGCKMLGDYIICAGAKNRYGEIIDTSLGRGIIIDSGDFEKTEPTTIDIATTW